MKAKNDALAFLSIFLSTSPVKERLLRFLPFFSEEKRQRYHFLDSSSLPSLLSNFSWMTPIHYSWFLNAIKELPANFKPLALTILTKEQRRGISEELNIEPEGRLTSFAAIFFLQYLKKEVKSEQVTELPLVDETALLPLLHIPKNKLLHLADVLGLYDLAADLRLIVDKQLLQKIYDSLALQQKQFLDYLSKQPVRFVSQKLDLAKWDGSRKQLNHVLHKRGLERLAKAAGLESHSFKWHLMHRFDVGRAKIIQKIFLQKNEPATLSFFKGQVLQLLKRI